MPYLWEMRQDDQWTAMPDNERIERDYCDPIIMHRYFPYSANVLRLVSVSHKTYYRNNTVNLPSE